MIQKSADRPVRTEIIKYPDGRVLHIKRVPRAKLADLWELQEKILEPYVANDYSFAALMMNEEALYCMETILQMLPTVEGEVIDFSLLEDDFEQLGRLFCSKSYKDDGTIEPLTPSIISSLHHFNYGGTVGKLIDLEVKRRAESEKLSSDQAI